VELGQLGPEEVVTPGIFVDRVAHIPYATSEA
jgi:acyl CoA:acetate/3-ketoacid CoA transferase alpha subunit